MLVGRKSRVRLAPTLALTLALAAAAAPAAGSVLVVTRTADGNPGSCTVVDCSLREALVAANGSAGGDVIVLGAGTYALTISGRGEEEGLAGDLDVRGDLTILGAGADRTTIDAGGLDRAFDLHGAVRLALYGVTVRNGDPGANPGGAIRAGAGSTVEVVRSTVADSRVGTHADGGGVYSLGRVVVTDSAVVGNAADGDGGGIAASGRLEVSNSTFSGNGSGHGFGGGIYLAANAELTLAASTLCDNMAMNTGGGVFVGGGAAAKMSGSVVAANTTWGGGPDCAGAVDSGGYNLIGAGHGCLGPADGVGGDRVGTLDAPLDPMLAPLAAVGGPTPTHDPLAGSPVVDAGAPAGSPGCAATDQRGERRTVDGDARCDIGAVELTDRCVAGPGVLCLLGGRFRVTADWATAAGGAALPAQAEAMTGDTGYFWFFRGDNVELVVKVLDACTGFDRFWVFASGLTNVGVELRVEDLVAGRTRVYTTAAGAAFAPIQDTDAFATCP
jgi:CSLREA domain-containing protein